MKTKKTVLLIDDTNFQAQARGKGKKADYLKLRDHLVSHPEGGPLAEAMVYVGRPPNIEEYRACREEKDRFVWWLRIQGFLVHTQTGKTNPNGRYTENCGMLLAVDSLGVVLKTQPDAVILVSGDSEFCPLFRRFRQAGIRTVVASTLSDLGYDLQAFANATIPLNKLVETFEDEAGEKS